MEKLAERWVAALRAFPTHTGDGPGDSGGEKVDRGPQGRRGTRLKGPGRILARRMPLPPAR